MELGLKTAIRHRPEPLRHHQETEKLSEIHSNQIIISNSLFHQKHQPFIALITRYDNELLLKTLICPIPLGAKIKQVNLSHLLLAISLTF